MLGPLRNFAQLPPERRSVVLSAMAELPRTALVLRRRGFAIAHRRALATPRAEPGLSNKFNEHQIANLCQMAIRRGPFKGRCLTQSLVLLRLLTKHGLEGHLEIGARKQEGELKAHAWVEDAQGEPLNDHGDITTEYAEFGMAANRRESE